MKKLLLIILTAGLLLYPFATFAADYGSQPSQTQQAPPVAQALVREGYFAVKLAAMLNLGSPTNEAEAEDMLAKAGVAPLNGWISDYPMTPEIVGQLKDSIASAASEGKLSMNSEEATKGLYSLASQMTLPTPAGEGATAPEGNNAPVGQSDSQTITNYYYDQGPPIITYYPPPVYYGYLYDWVPYPVFWFGFWFPGYYVCNSFTKVVWVNSRPFIVSNNVIDHHGRRVAVVDPVVRTNTGGVRPITTLRTEDGRTFRNLTDLRNGASLTGPNTGRPGAYSNSALRTQGFRSPEAWKNAEAIYSRSVERTRSAVVRDGGMAARGVEGRTFEPITPERTFNGPVRGGGERRLFAPESSGRPFRYSMMRGSNGSVRRFTAPGGPSMGSARQLVARGAPSRSFSGSMVRGGNYSMRSFSGNGWRGR
ncbi:MAG TPA: hypothetical protein VL087_09975 [Nitrospirota bacterium]|nr:hypothetical protein [Nitrospirota bacterium]